MLRVVGPKVSYSILSSVTGARLGYGRTMLSLRSGASRRDVSNVASGRTKTNMALRSWKGRHQQFQETAKATTTTRSILSQTLGGTRRTFFSPTQQELLRSSSSLSPLEEFLMDAIAWSVAFSLWYILNMEVDDDDLLGDNCDGDNTNDDRHLEYREDYGPTVSQRPPRTSPGSKTRKTSIENSKPKDNKREE